MGEVPLFTAIQDFWLQSNPTENVHFRHSVAHWATTNPEVDSFRGESTLAK